MMRRFRINHVIGLVSCGIIGGLSFAGYGCSSPAVTADPTEEDSGTNVVNQPPVTGEEDAGPGESDTGVAVSLEAAVALNCPAFGTMNAVPTSCCVGNALQQPGALNDVGDNLMMKCGATAAVPAGTFQRYNVAGDAAKATLTADTHLELVDIDVGRFSTFVAAEAWRAGVVPIGAGAHPRVAGSGWKREWDENLPECAGREDCSNSLEAGIELTAGTKFGYCSYDKQERFKVDNADHRNDGARKPMNCVSWYLAFAFCAWDGGFIPSEAEFERAAKADDARPFPWGTAAQADLSERKGYYCLGADANTEGGGYLNDPFCANPENIAPKHVGWGINGKGKYGHLDLVGQGWKWTRDPYRPAHDEPLPTPCTDCVNPDNYPNETPRYKVWGLSSWYTGSYEGRPQGIMPLTERSKVGVRATAYGADAVFRCARYVPTAP